MNSVPQSDERSPLYAELVRRHERRALFAPPAIVSFTTECSVARSERLCPVCGVEVKGRPNKVYCSHDCSKNASAARRIAEGKNAHALVLRYLDNWHESVDRRLPQR